MLAIGGFVVLYIFMILNNLQLGEINIIDLKSIRIVPVVGNDW